MMKRLLAMVLILCLLPLWAAALEYRKEGISYIVFPELDEWQGRFNRRDNWVIVTPETLDEHWEMVAARGDTEEEIRARYAADTFLFEAYSPDIPADSCFRAERFENEHTRDIWHLRHWSDDDFQKVKDYLTSGRAIPNKDVYGLIRQGHSANRRLVGYFTNYPPETLESGRIHLELRNGKLYVFSYCVSGRMVGNESALVEDAEFSWSSPVCHDRSIFLNEAMPRMVLYELEEAFPEDVTPGNVRVSGTAQAGSRMEVTLDGKRVPGAIRDEGDFIVILPLKETGEHQVEMTFNRSGYAERKRTYTVRVSEEMTPLTLLEKPEPFSDLGTMTVSGRTERGANVALWVDGDQTASCLADENGLFSFSFEIKTEDEHSIRLTARAEGKLVNEREISFIACWMDAEKALKEYKKETEKPDHENIWANPGEHLGEKVAFPVYVWDVQTTAEGLFARCVYGRYANTAVEHMYYVNIKGYARCMFRPREVLTVYGEVSGAAPYADKDGTEYMLPVVEAEFITNED